MHFQQLKGNRLQDELKVAAFSLKYVRTFSHKCLKTFVFSILQMKLIKVSKFLIKRTTFSDSQPK